MHHRHAGVTAVADTVLMMKTHRALLLLALLTLATPSVRPQRPRDQRRRLDQQSRGAVPGTESRRARRDRVGPGPPQSGRGAAIVMYSTSVIVATSDPQILAEGGCHNGAAPLGAPAVGPFTKAGYINGDYHYVHGTPELATLYGLDVLAQARWGRAPDVVLSGPNEGQNVGLIVISSGTVGNAQFAAGRGIPSIALSAGTNTVDNTTLADPDSAIVAELTMKLLAGLEAAIKHDDPLLPEGVALNVNFPNTATPDSEFAFSRIGSFEAGSRMFRNTPPYGLGVTFNNPADATAAQAEDEALVSSTKVSVTAMQVSFDHDTVVQNWLRRSLRKWFR